MQIAGVLRSKVRHLICAGAALLLLSSCGGEDGLDSQVTVRISPQTPIVINADWRGSGGDSGGGGGEEGSDEKTFKGPWFKFDMWVNNQSDRPVVIVGVVLKMTTFKDGRSRESTLSIAPTGSARSLVEVPPNTELPGFSSWVIYNLGESDTGSWQVEMTFEGWFGTYEEPEKSYKRSYYFTANN